MITKQRLEELIEQEATIYQVYADVTVIKMKLDKDFKVDDAHLWKKLKGAVKSCGYPLYKLFEVKEEAERYKEFGNITRTERLELPTWEEFDKKGYFEFVSADGTKLVLEKTLTVDCDREPISYYVLEILVNDYDHRLLFEAEYTKENYTLACRKAKELFLLGNN